MHHGLDNTYLYAVSKITLLISNGLNRTKLYGTGFFIIKDANIYLITNRHVVQPEWNDPQYQGYHIDHILFDRRDYNEALQKVDVETLEIVSYEIFYPENALDDIACITNISICDEWSKKLPICIEYSMLATSTQIETDLSICDHVALIGFPIVYDHKHNTPILRSGVISSDPRLDYSYNGKDMGHLLAYEMFSTSGASGSPVFAIQKGIKFGKGFNVPEGFYRPVRLIGINAGSIFTKNDGVHQQMSYMFKSDQIIRLIEQAESKIHD